MSAINEPTEASPLIQEANPNPHNQEQLQTHDSRWTKDAIRTASLAAAFLILSAFADVLKYISTVRLIELGVCREHYLENDRSLIDNDGNIPEHLCKSPGIQQRLAHLRGYLAALEAIVGLLLALPYGLLVDRLGERLLAGINVIGYLLSCAWLLIVCFYWSAFPIWSAVLAPLFRVIGGGSPVLASVIYSIAAKHVPDANRLAPMLLILFGHALLIAVIDLSASSFSWLRSF
jgi:MFS family permease